jgi:chemotaxis family two-component system sensor kinase Cph1
LRYCWSGALITHDLLPDVKGEGILLAQLLQNLIANAIKYCKGVPCIHIGAVQENGQWRISVQDNGIGIPAAQHKHIFSIFRRLHAEEDYPGIGLGLAICDRIVKQHGGSIEVRSEPDRGACFLFALPGATADCNEEKRVAYG